MLSTEELKDNTEEGINLDKYFNIIKNTNLIPLNGRVTQVIGLVIESTGPDVGIGEICEVITGRTSKKVLAEVVGFRNNRVLLMPIGDIGNIHPGCSVISTGKVLSIKVGKNLLGRILNGFGEPIDNKGEIVSEVELPVYNKPPSVLKRKRITEPICLGIRAIDGLLTVGKGQRIGIFAGSGVGKSTLLGSIARNTNADINVIALIGERGREVREFIEKDLGEEGIKKSVVVAVTSDEAALLRVKGAYVATTIAEYYRSKGYDVNLMLDSITRFCMAKREIGLSIGEPPTSKGYTPSVFSELPKLLERAGTDEKGSITGIYTVLVEGDDMDEPISDAVRAILDGHIVLSRELANLNHYPPIDVLSSVSRLMTDVVTALHKKTADTIKDFLAVYRKSKDLIDVGAYSPGSNPKLDIAVGLMDKINSFLRQEISEKETFDSSIKKLIEILPEDLRKSLINTK